MANKDQVKVEGGGDFDGAILKNAATEATLQKLLEIFERKKKGTGDKLKQLEDEARKKGIVGLDNMTDSYKAFRKELEPATKALSKFASTVSNIIGLGLGVTFSLIAEGGKALANFFTTGFDAFQKVSRVGAGFNNDITLLRRSAAESAMPLDMFVDTIKQNSQAFAALGGTVTQGAQQFGKLSKDFRNSEVGQQMLGLGFTASELNDIIANQIDLDMRSGKLRGRDSASLRKETEDYVKELDKLTKLTGLNRQQVQDGMNKIKKDGRLLTLQSKLSGDALKNFRTGVGLMNANFDASTVESLTNMMSGVIEPGDDFASFLAQAAPGVQEFNRNLAKGTMSVEDQIRGYKDQRDAITAYLSKFSDQAIQQNKGLQQLQIYNASLQNLADSNTEQALKEQNARNKITSALGKFEQFVNTLFGDILVTLIDSPVFKELEKGLGELAEVFDKNKGKITNVIMPIVNGFINILTRVVNSFTTLLKGTDLTSEGISKFFSDTFKEFKDGFNNLFGGIFGESPEKKAKREAYERASPEQRAVMEQEDPSLKGGGIFESMKEGLKGLLSLLPSLADLSSFFGIAAGGSLLAGAGLAAGMALVALGLDKLVAPAWKLTIPVGVLGAAFWALSESIKATGVLFDKVGNFFNSMKDVNWDSIAKGTMAISSLGLAMSAVGAGGILNFFGSGGVDRLIDSLKKINDINIDKVTQTGPALKSFQEGLAAFTSGGVLDTLGSGIKEFIHGEGLDTMITSLNKIQDIKISSISGINDFFKSVQPFLDPATFDKMPTSVETIKTSLSKIGEINFASIENTVSGLGKVTTTINESFNNQAKGVDDYIKSIDKLTDSLTKLQDQMKDMPKTVPTALTSNNSNTKVIASGGDIAGNSPDDLQKQLNTKIDDLITHIIEMKQNTKDAADSLNGRRNVV